MPGCLDCPTSAYNLNLNAQYNTTSVCLPTNVVEGVGESSLSVPIEQEYVMSKCPTCAEGAVPKKGTLPRVLLLLYSSTCCCCAEQSVV